MSDNARNAILTRLRSAPPGAEIPERDESVLRRHQWGLRERVERFRARMEAAHARVITVYPEGWPAALSELLAERPIRTLLHAPESPIGRSLGECALPLPELRRYPDTVEAFKAELFHGIDAAITSAHAGIAETGTLVLWPTPEEPRLMSLVPPLHIAVLDSARIYRTFHEAMSEEGWAARMPTNLLLISGPSKTADIEQTLAYGVHGPRELVVLLLDRGE
ncbi:MAG: lactate utilization protein [Gammaproteobacteria bacterium]